MAQKDKLRLRVLYKKENIASRTKDPSKKEVLSKEKNSTSNNKTRRRANLI